MAAYNPFTRSIAFDCGDGDIVLERIRTTFTKYRYKHTVLPGETLAGISRKYYGVSGMWGEIADVNAIYNPFIDLKPGSELIIP
jgi:nucleoid-associated protein YgaU